MNFYETGWQSKHLWSEEEREERVMVVIRSVVSWVCSGGTDSGLLFVCALDINEGNHNPEPVDT